MENLINNIKKDLKIIWMNFKDYQEQICTLRKKIFVEEQGLPSYLQTDPNDEAGLHMGAFFKGELISVLSVYIFYPNHEIFEKYQLPPAKTRIVQLSRRAELPAYRGTRLAELIACATCKSIFETLRPDYYFITLISVHNKLKVYYKSYSFESYKNINTIHGTLSLMLSEKEIQLKTFYIKAKKYTETLSKRYELYPPSLLFFLKKNNNLALLILCNFKKENLYIQHLSLKDELPRLINQAHLVYSAQKKFLRK